MVKKKFELHTYNLCGVYIQGVTKRHFTAFGHRYGSMTLNETNKNKNAR